MSRGQHVRQVAIERALKGVHKAGQVAERIEVRPDGGFSILLKGDPVVPQEPADAFDRWKAKNDARST